MSRFPLRTARLRKIVMLFQPPCCSVMKMSPPALTPQASQVPVWHALTVQRRSTACRREEACSVSVRRSATTPSLVLVPVFSPCRAAFCCPSDQRRGVVQLPGSLRRSAAHVATEHATVALSAAQQHSVWLWWLVVLGGAWCLVVV